MNKKKLLYIVEAMGGGVFSYIVDLTNELVNEYDIYLAYAVRPQTPSNYIKYFDKRIHLLKVKNLESSINLVKDFKAFFEIRTIAKKINPDIIHLHSSKAGVLGRWAFNGKKVPIFYTPHGYSFLMSNYSNIKKIIYKFIELISAKRSCITISCSISEHKETLKLTKHAVYVDNGININQLQKALNYTSKNSKEELFTVFTLGRICYQKNPKLFNKIAKMMPNIRFLWIGDGELREQLTASNIEITGWINREIALKKSMEADVFILTTLGEGLPISLLEAMYMKKPCIVSNVMGNRDVIHNGENGFICNKATEFVKYIQYCKLSSVNTIVNTAYQNILEHYNTQNMAKHYSRIYRGGRKKVVKYSMRLFFIYKVTIREVVVA